MKYFFQFWEMIPVDSKYVVKRINRKAKVSFITRECYDIEEGRVTVFFILGFIPIYKSFTFKIPE